MAAEAPPKKKNLWERFLDKVAHKGHKDLLIRGLCALGHAILSTVLAATGNNTPHALPDCICQYFASWTLIVQFRTANYYLFIARGLSSWARMVIIIHGAACGRTWPDEECRTTAWSDARLPMRVFACLAALRMFANGLSLILQYKFPTYGVGQHGNLQLFYRGYIQASGIPIHYCVAMLKLGQLTGTDNERSSVEIVVHFIRAFIVIPFAVWSLFDQWVATGAGKKTDDIRTSNLGESHPNAADKLTAKIAPHKGHRNLLIRSVCAFCQASATAWLLAYEQGRPGNTINIIAQVASSMSLFVQWRTGNPKMFLVRGFANWFACIAGVYVTICSQKWPHHDECTDKAWFGDKRPMAILSACASLRLFLNGCSLMCQYNFPHVMFKGHGNLQLFVRGSVQLTGVPIHLARFFYKTLEFDGVPIDYTVNFLRGMIFIPIGASSLWHQWYHTSAGNTGHPRSDLFEREGNPNIVDPEERIRVTIISAKGLRRADITGKSDPYCVCHVPGRPESAFQTQVINKTLEPVWNETQEVPGYKILDSLELIVRDHDDEAKTPCCKFFDDGDDLLGKATLKCDQLHPNGFEGEVKLTHAGRNHKHAVVNVKIELLGLKEETDADGIGKKLEDAATTAVKEVEDEVVVAAKEVGEAVREVEAAAEGAGTTLSTAATTAEGRIGESLGEIALDLGFKQREDLQVAV